MVILDREPLIEGVREGLAELNETLDSIAEHELWDRVATGDWTVKDTLAVRTRWTEMLSSWISQGLDGLTPRTPAPGFKWNETPRLNGQIVRDEAGNGPEELRSRLDATVDELIGLIDCLDEDQLMLTEQFGWTRSWCVSRWISMNTITQYRSLRKMARRVLRERAA
jgi:hypothetical protein